MTAQRVGVALPVLGSTSGGLDAAPEPVDVPGAGDVVDDPDDLDPDVDDAEPLTDGRGEVDGAGTVVSGAVVVGVSDGVSDGVGRGVVVRTGAGVTRCTYWLSGVGRTTKYSTSTATKNTVRNIVERRSRRRRWVTSTPSGPRCRRRPCLPAR